MLIEIETELEQFLAQETNREIKVSKDSFNESKVQTHLDNKSNAETSQFSEELLLKLAKSQPALFEKLIMENNYLVI